MNKKHIISVFALCCAFVVSPLAKANTGDEVKDTDKTLKVEEQVQSTDPSVNERVDKLEKALSFMPKISGYLQTGYVWNDKYAGNNSTFQMKRMRLILDKQISPMFDYRAQFEVFGTTTDGGNAVGKYKKKSMALMDAFINVHFDKALHFRVGQYYLPIGFENYDSSPASLETIDFSNICYRMVCRNPISSKDFIDYGRDLGVMAYGDLFPSSNQKFNYLSYNLSVSNGNIITQVDDNKSKDLVGRLTFRPIEKLRVMASYNWGEYNGVVKQVDGSELLKKNLSTNRFVAGAWYFDPEGLSLRSEYGHMRSSEGNVKENAFYVLAAYKVGKFLPVARYELYRDRENKAAANANKDAILVGCTYAPIKHFKLQAAYTHTMYTKRVEDATGTKDGNGIQLMAVAYF